MGFYLLRPFLGLQVEPGSIVSSNLLTLLVLPTLYAWSERDEDAEAKERLSTAKDDPPCSQQVPPRRGVDRQRHAQEGQDDARH